jgi:hypothetical protein
MKVQSHSSTTVLTATVNIQQTSHKTLQLTHTTHTQAIPVAMSEPVHVRCAVCAEAWYPITSLWIEFIHIDGI